MVLDTVIGYIATYKPEHPERPMWHGAIIRECTRIFQIDSLWQQTIAQNKKLARAFHLEPLLLSNNSTLRAIGETMVQLMIVLIPNIDIGDIVEENMIHKVQTLMVKSLMDSQVGMRARINSLEEVMDGFLLSIGTIEKSAENKHCEQLAKIEKETASIYEMIDVKFEKHKGETLRRVQAHVLRELRETDIKDSFDKIEAQVLKSVTKIEHGFLMLDSRVESAD